MIAETAGESSNLGDLEKNILLAAREMTENVAMPEALFKELQAELGNQARTVHCTA